MINTFVSIPSLASQPVSGSPHRRINQRVFNSSAVLSSTQNHSNLVQHGLGVLAQLTNGVHMINNFFARIFPGVFEEKQTSPSAVLIALAGEEVHGKIENPEYEIPEPMGVEV